MDRLTTVLGDDLKAAKIDQQALAERLADIDGLRAQVRALTEEKQQLQQQHEAQKADLGSQISNLEEEKAALTAEVARLTELHKGVSSAVDTLGEAVPQTEIGEALGGELYAFVLKDSRVPRTVIDGVGKFIDFRKYLRLAATRGAEEATRRSAENVRSALGK
jgi:chromosome segregation ATPase